VSRMGVNGGEVAVKFQQRFNPWVMEGEQFLENLGVSRPLMEAPAVRPCIELVLFIPSFKRERELRIRALGLIIIVAHNIPILCSGRAICFYCYRSSTLQHYLWVLVGSRIMKTYYILLE
jgi:hypothetical protein